MNKTSSYLLLLMTLAGNLLCSYMALAQGLTITNVHIIDAQHEQPSEPVNVYIEEGKIQRIQPYLPHHTDSPKKGWTTLDGNGGYLLPGLWDMHVHLQELQPESLGRFIDAGVTQVRDMGMPPSSMAALKNSVRQGAINGPEIYGSGYMVNSQKWQTLFSQVYSDEIMQQEMQRRLVLAAQQDIAATVTAIRDSGADFAKLHFWHDSPELFAAFARALEDADLKLAGHHPGPHIGIEQIAASGIDSLEHLDGIIGAQFAGLDKAQQQQILNVFRQSELHFVPSLVASESLMQLDGIAEMRDRMAVLTTLPDAQLADEALIEFWQKMLKMLPEKLPGWQTFAADIRMLKQAASNDVHILPGTDLGVPGVLPGVSLIRELELMHSKLGMSTHQVIKAATLDAATWLGQEQWLGTVAEGKRANLIVSAENPLHDLSHLKNLSAVIINGSVHRD